MGKLFWKFFLFLWLAQFFTVLVVSLAIGLFESEPDHHAMHPPPGDLAAEMSPQGPPSPPPTFRQESRPASQPADGETETSPESRAFGGGGPPPPGQFDANGMPGLPSGDQPPPGPPPWGQSPPGPPPGESPPPPNGLSLPSLPLISGSVISLLFAALLARYFAQPIRILRKAFESVATGKLGTRIGHAMGNRRDELTDLGAGFDSMAERLQSLVDGKQRLLHDVSHELRSPLARLQASIDLMQQQPNRSAEFIARIERESGRIDRLVGELLTLARLDSGIPGNQLMILDLNEVIEAIAEDASFEAETKECRVVTKLPDKCCLMGNPELLYRAIENVVRNAIRHTPSGSSVTITAVINPEKTWLSLEIMDEGTGVKESDLKLLFEPFYRSPTADSFKGYGMGMAITRRVIAAHKGKVSASNRREGGLCVSIGLPTADENSC